MPLTDQGGRNGALTGGNGMAGVGDQQQYLNPTGPPPGTQQTVSQVPNVEPWRFKRHDDLWWYYTPQRTWAVLQSDRWVAYQRDEPYARDDRANAILPGSAEAQQRVTAGDGPDNSGNGMGNGTYNGARVPYQQ